MEKISVLVVEDHPIYREGIVGAIQSFAEQLDLLQANRPVQQSQFIHGDRRCRASLPSLHGPAAG